jgi:hypothetical protein
MLQRIWVITFSMAIAALGLSATAYAADGPRSADGSAAPSPEQLAFFESKIRPVLVEQCYKCHSVKSEKLKGSLYVDGRDGLLHGGDSGPALVPGDPEKSRLIESLRYTNDDMQMPPKGKLPDAVIKDFESWVKMGAPWPNETRVAAKPKGPDFEQLKREHWSLQPVRRPAVPAVRDAAWPASPIDRFVLAGLEQKGIRPVADADRVTLIRRVYFDLIGLPPTPEQIAEFIADNKPNAYERLVDELLASPHFGERWGRHWLDVARYADSLTLRGFVLKDAWRYRDYVIDQFNSDRPFDRFMIEQVAGDLMPAASDEDRRRQLTGTTFLALGNTNLEEQDKKMLRMDVVDEQLDTLGKAFLGQTLGCARCHDHKFDPIPTADYYALAGILRSTKTLEHSNVSKWLEVPLPDSPEREAELKKNEAAIADLQARLKETRAALTAAEKGKDPERRRPGKASLVRLADLPGIVIDDSAAQKVGEWKNSPSVAGIGEGYIQDLNAAKGEKTVTFQPAELPQNGKYEVRLAYVPGPNRATNVKVTIFSADGEKFVEVNQQDPPPIDGHWISLGQHTFEKSGAGFVMVSNDGTKGFVIADAVQFIPVDRLAEIDAAAAARKSAAAAPATQPAAVVADPAAELQEQIKSIEAEIRRAQHTGPRRKVVISVLEEKEIGDSPIHIRGSVQNLGPAVPRGFLSAVPVSTKPQVPVNQSGRLQLGQWLASPENPLPPRVTANRVWHWLIGQGLSRTVDNFGVTGEAPSHPELLDYLATRLMEQKWSVKSLVREIVLSRTYRLGYADDAAARAADPENRLCWRANRQRLDGESLRDAMLLVSGALDTTAGGPTQKPSLASDYSYKHTDHRRSVYAPVFRNSILEIVEAFDMADPSMTTGRRNFSTVAPQALYMMNHPFVHEQAKVSAGRLLSSGVTNPGERVDVAYRRTLGRLPTDGEKALVLRYLDGVAKGPRDAELQAWTSVFHGLFASIDFRYVN